MIKYLTILLLITAAVSAGEEPLENFAGGYRLRTGGEAAIYRVALPAEVYRTIVRRDLGDIRVFNGAGEQVPHAVRRPEGRRIRQTSKVALPFFPVGSDIDNLRDNADLDISIAENGSVVRIRSRKETTPADNAEHRDYLIDLSGLNRPVDELAFDVTGGGNGYIGTASLQFSDDLNTWRSLVEDVTLARLDYGGHSLEKNTIKLPNRTVRYLRFRWSDKAGSLKINAVHATLSSVRTAQDRRWSETEGRRSEADERVFEFDTRGLYPIDRIHVLLPEDNTLVEAVLRSRGDTDAAWRQRHSGLFYNLQVDGNHLRRGPLSVRPLAHRYWQLRVKTRGGMGSQPPLLQFGWIPNDLYFLARGEEPFTLAFGNGRLKAPGRPIQALMNVIDDDQAAHLTGEAELGESVTLMGEKALAPELAIPWQRILLWSVLVIGVIVIGVMAIRLFNQLNTGE